MLRLIQISDLHLRGEPHSRLREVDVDAGLAAVLAHIRARHWPVDALLATGDLAHEDPAAYVRLRELLTPLQVPVYCLPGNHDVTGFAAALAGGEVRHERRIIAGGWQIVLLDSTIPGEDGGHLAPTELDHLDNTLGQSPELPALICVHHHPVPVGTAWLDSTAIDNPQALFEILDRHPQTRALIWGHIHQAYAGQRNGVALLSAPSTCVQFLPGQPLPNVEVHQQPGYRWLDLMPDGQLRSAVEWVDL